MLNKCVIDGATYLAIGVLGSLIAAFASDEAAKYIAPEILFWLRTGCASLMAGVLAFKTFRSTSYAEHRSNGKTDTSIISKP